MGCSAIREEEEKESEKKVTLSHSMKTYGGM
jgi:hypothetical protein